MFYLALIHISHTNLSPPLFFFLMWMKTGLYNVKAGARPNRLQFSCRYLTLGSEEGEEVASNPEFLEQPSHKKERAKVSDCKQENAPRDSERKTVNIINRAKEVKRQVHSKKIAVVQKNKSKDYMVNMFLINCRITGLQFLSHGGRPGLDTFEISHHNKFRTDQKASGRNLHVQPTASLQLWGDALNSTYPSSIAKPVLFASHLQK